MTEQTTSDYSDNYARFVDGMYESTQKKVDQDLNGQEIVLELIEVQ